MSSLKQALTIIAFLLWGLNSGSAFADPVEQTPGFRHLTTKGYLHAVFGRISRDEWFRLDHIWPAASRARLSRDPHSRADIILDRYGLPPAPYPNRGLPMGFSDLGRGQISVNCLSCHGGTVLGQPTFGAPNQRLDVMTYISDLSRLQAAEPRPGDLLGHIGRLASSLGGLGCLPLNQSRGVTNAFCLSAYALSLRDNDMTPRFFARNIGHISNTDLDAPAWWLLKRKTRLYSDGFAPATPRSVMQFALDPRQNAQAIQNLEPEFEDIFRTIRSIEAPRYPFLIDDALLRRGRIVYEANCRECHGLGADYPELRVPLRTIGTDPLRLTSGLTPEFRRVFQQSWLGGSGSYRVDSRPNGYMAPPLDGVWATAPYFHNGSVPTLEEVLDPRQRSAVWKPRTDYAFDESRVGLQVERLTQIPRSVTTAPERRRYFDSRLPGKSNRGHAFGSELTAIQRRELLEFLKSL